jgi:thiamine biosynthesis lipoprotein
MDKATAKFYVFKFSHDAMNTYNRISIYHDDKIYAEQAAAAVFREMDRLENMLSRFTPGSDIWQINHTSANTSIPLNLETYECLSLAIQLSKLTEGAFDVTLGSLYELWKNNATPEDNEINRLRSRTGTDFIQLSKDSYAITALTEEISIDLGAVGKGYIIDKAADVLEEWELPAAMINSGGSSLLALEPPGKKDGWGITCGTNRFSLKQGAVSGSGTAEQGEHIIDPRTGRPAEHTGRQWAMAPTAAIADALSTAAMVMTAGQKESLRKNFPAVKFISG